MSGDIILSKSWQQQKSAQSALGPLGQSPYQCELRCTFCPWNLAKCLASMGCRVGETMLPALRDCWESQLSICLHFSPLATVLFPYLNPFQCSNLSNPFHLFQFKLQSSTCSTFPIRYSSLQFNCAHHDGNSHTPQPASAFVALWRGIGWSVSCHKGHATGVMAGTPRSRVISLNGGRPNFVGSILREFHGLKIHCRDL